MVAPYRKDKLLRNPSYVRRKPKPKPDPKIEDQLSQQSSSPEDIKGLVDVLQKAYNEFKASVVFITKNAAYKTSFKVANNANSFTFTALDDELVALPSSTTGHAYDQSLTHDSATVVNTESSDQTTPRNSDATDFCSNKAVDSDELVSDDESLVSNRDKQHFYELLIASLARTNKSLFTSTPRSSASLKQSISSLLDKTEAAYNQDRVEDEIQIALDHLPPELTNRAHNMVREYSQGNLLSLQREYADLAKVNPHFDAIIKTADPMVQEHPLSMFLNDEEGFALRNHESNTLASYKDDYINDSIFQYMKLLHYVITRRVPKSA